jgi:hypothetical protein
VNRFEDSDSLRLIFYFILFYFFPEQAVELSYHKFVLLVVTYKSFLLSYKQSNMLEHASFFS